MCVVGGVPLCIKQSEVDLSRGHSARAKEVKETRREAFKVEDTPEALLGPCLCF